MTDLQHWPLDRFIEYARNPRKNDQAVDKIASAIREFGFRCPVLAKSDGSLVDGHLRLKAAKKLKLETIPVMLVDDLTDTQIKALRISVNRMADLAEWDQELLALELEDLRLDDFNLDLAGFDSEALDKIFDDVAGKDAEESKEGLTDPDEVPEVETKVPPTTKTGDVWILGDHRVMCGDSTKPEDVARLMNGKKAQLIHADPPYGMKKEGEGVANDNLNSKDLCDFQMAWWKAFRPHAEDNASSYIWGNAEELWRLWYVGGLCDSERLTFRNQIVWQKGAFGSGGGSGVGQAIQRSYFPETEHLMFFMLGEQGFNNNADNYWEGFEPIRSYLDGERKRSGLTTAQCNDICGKQNMTQSAFTKGGFRLILKEDYEKLRDACKGDAFKKDYDAFKKDYDELKKEFYSTRAYFDNTHDNMTDVWEFQRVRGEERHEHATPKPVAMMERVMKSSLPAGGLCVEPFGGSGSTLMGAERTGRACYTMELQPIYCDTIVKRWEQFTGRKAELWISN